MAAFLPRQSQSPHLLTLPPLLPRCPLSDPPARKREGVQEGYLAGGLWFPLDTSCLYRGEAKNKAEWEGLFSSSSFPGQSLVSGPGSGLKDPN